MKTKTATRQRTPDVRGATGSPRSPQPDGGAHTPGPWTVGESNTGDADSIGIHSDEWCVADVWKDVDELETAAVANANLMAASPDLLKVAKSTLEYWEATGFAQCDKDCDCIVEGMRAAIAKAEGR